MRQDMEVRSGAGARVETSGACNAPSVGFARHGPPLAHPAPCLSTDRQTPDSPPDLDAELSHAVLRQLQHELAHLPGSGRAARSDWFVA